MLTPAGVELKRTPLNAAHRAAGARLVEFAGWEMPVEYSGIPQEHVAVRTAAGLFDVSHMGEIEVRGRGALPVLQYVTSNDVAHLEDYQAQYTALMAPTGGAVDDLIVHRLAEDLYLLSVNAANTEKDFEWIRLHNRFGAEVRNVSEEYAQLALQGPRAGEILAPVTDANLVALRPFRFCRATCCGVAGLLARTGYTGEDGFEFYFPPAESQEVWSGLVEAGKAAGLVAAGLGARNTLRLEAAYPLYGHEIDEETTLLEAGLGWIAKLEKGDFVGREALLEQRRAGLRKKLVGFEMLDRGIARESHTVWIESKLSGRVTSGSYAPFLRKNIGMAYVPPERAEAGREVEIEIRGKRARVRLVPLPFYKRSKVESSPSSRSET